MNPARKRKADECIDRMRDLIRLRNYSLATERRYTAELRKYIAWLTGGPGAAHARSTPRDKLEAYLTSLARRDCAASTQNGAMAALLFWYVQVLKTPIEGIDAMRAKRGERVRQSPSIDDVRRLLMAVRDTGQYPTRLITFLIYGCGLRLGETVSIRLKDIDVAAAKLTVVGGKGNKDRFINLPASLLPQLAIQIQSAEVTSAKARNMGVPVKLPNLLAVKYPAARFSPKWFWLFPQSAPCHDPRGGSRVWWHCLEGTVRAAVRSAARRAGLDAAISPHHLRHAWATHAHDSGAHIRDLQEILGHRDPKTTMRYLRPDPERVPSPLESLQLIA